MVAAAPPKRKRKTLKDGATIRLNGVTYRYDAAAAERAVRFLETFMVHFRGRLAGQHLVLEEWQKEQIIRPLFGWKRPDGRRRFTEAFVFIPRKNGKTFLAAGIALYCMAADNEEGAEVYCAAADQKQARLVFDTVKEQISRNASLTQVMKAYQYSVIYPKKTSKMEVISSEAYSKHGFNASAVIIDELHAHRNRELYDVLVTSMVQRDQPITFIITTAGVYDSEHIAYEKYAKAKAVLDDPEIDPFYLPVIFEADERDDWQDPKVWHKANPGLAEGKLVKEEKLSEKCNSAKLSPSEENVFRRLHLNQWTEQAERWLQIDRWNECRQPPFDTQSAECILGVDLSLSTDLSAVVAVFPSKTDAIAQRPTITEGMTDDQQRIAQAVDHLSSQYRVWVEPHFWLPDHDLDLKERRDHAAYRQWEKGKYLTLVDGRVIDDSLIEEYILKACEKYRVRKICFDPYAAAGVAKRLEARKLPVVFVKQGWLQIAPASKVFERLVLSGRLNHAGHPVMDYCARNVAVKRDDKGNVWPVKGRSRGRIDGVTAAITAISELMLEPFEAPKRTSRYETEGITLL